MKLGDDIHSLLQNIHHDTSVYQDLAQYNAAKLARMKMKRLPAVTSAESKVPEHSRQPGLPDTTGLTAILQRLANPVGTAAMHQPPRLDLLFSRLIASTDTGTVRER
jgi:hypothetical protein